MLVVYTSALPPSPPRNFPYLVPRAGADGEGLPTCSSRSTPDKLAILTVVHGTGNVNTCNLLTQDTQYAFSAGSYLRKVLRSLNILIDAGHLSLRNRRFLGVSLLLPAT